MSFLRCKEVQTSTLDRNYIIFIMTYSYMRNQKSGRLLQTYTHVDAFVCILVFIHIQSSASVTENSCKVSRDSHWKLLLFQLGHQHAKAHQVSGIAVLSQKG